MNAGSQAGLQQIIAAFSFAASCLYCLMPNRFMSEKSGTRVFGALLLTSIALFASNWVVFSLAIFFIATFITELSFIENVAALFFNRPEFWDFRKSNNQEQKEKQAEEAREAAQIQQEITDMVPLSDQGNPEDTTEPSPSLNLYRVVTDVAKIQNDLSDFESRVAGNIHAFFDPRGFTIESNRMLSGERRKYFVDYVVRLAKRRFIVEVKYSPTAEGIKKFRERGIEQLKVYRAAYVSYLTKKGFSNDVKLVLALRYFAEQDGSYGITNNPDIFVLGCNLDGTFANDREFGAWLGESEP